MLANITLYTVYFITQYPLRNPKTYKLQYRVGEVEQFAAADLLAVILFANYYVWFGKKSCQLAQAAELHRYTE